MDLHDRIAQVAYDLYEKSGKVDGRELNNWLEAEKIVTAQTSLEIQSFSNPKPDRRKGQRRKI